jgi:hypothetical protein
MEYTLLLVLVQYVCTPTGTVGSWKYIQYKPGTSQENANALATGMNVIGIFFSSLIVKRHSCRLETIV